MLDSVAIQQQLGCLKRLLLHFDPDLYNFFRKLLLIPQMKRNAAICSFAIEQFSSISSASLPLIKSCAYGNVYGVLQAIVISTCLYVWP